MEQNARELICNIKGHVTCDCWTGFGPFPEHDRKDKEEQIEPHCRRCGKPYDAVFKTRDVSHLYGLPPGCATETEFEAEE